MSDKAVELNIGDVNKVMRSFMVQYDFTASANNCRQSFCDARAKRNM
jgi:hypothetical protein